ncbi:MAG: pyridoxamine 5'-phosphate oxidase, partial [Afipia sp.]|nr:pyridoxamine 5'-phosphate oxidase [Afipia sp.]
DAWMVEGDAALTEAVMPADYAAVPERVLLFKIAAWDPNCPQHIPRKLDADEVDALLAERDRRIVDLETRLAMLGGN